VGKCKLSLPNKVIVVDSVDLRKALNPTHPLAKILREALIV